MAPLRLILVTSALASQLACAGMSALGTDPCDLRPNSPACLGTADSDAPDDVDDGADDLPPLTFDTAIEPPEDPLDEDPPFDPVIAHWTFETCPDGWDLRAPWQCGLPGGGPSGAAEGSGVLATNLSGNYPHNASWTAAFAASPLLTVPPQGATLSFQAWWHFESVIYDGWHVAVFPDGQSGSVLATDLPYDSSSLDSLAAWGGNASPHGWRTLTANLSPWAGQNIRVRFAMRSDSTVHHPGAYIDDVRVTANAP